MVGSLCIFQKSADTVDTDGDAILPLTPYRICPVGKEVSMQHDFVCDHHASDMIVFTRSGVRFNATLQTDWQWLHGLRPFRVNAANDLIHSPLSKTSYSSWTYDPITINDITYHTYIMTLPTTLDDLWVVRGNFIKIHTVQTLHDQWLAFKKIKNRDIDEVGPGPRTRLDSDDW